MGKLKLKSITNYRDGGTIMAEFENGNVYYVDRRFGSSTPGAIFMEYPKDGLTHIEDKPLAKALEQILAAISIYKNERLKERIKYSEAKDFDAYDKHKSEDVF